MLILVYSPKLGGTPGDVVVEDVDEGQIVSRMGVPVPAMKSPYCILFVYKLMMQDGGFSP